MSGKRLWLLAGLALLLAACGGGAPPQDLALAGVTPDSPAVAQGGSLSLTLTLASQNGFQGQVSLSVTENGQPPSWLSLSPTSATLNVPKGGQAQVGLQVQVAGNAPTGAHALKLKVSYGDKAAERDLTLTVAPPPSFTLALGATSLALEQGGSSATPLTVTPQNGFTGTVSLALAAGQDQVPQGLSLSPGSVQVSGANPVTQTLTLSALSSTPTGTYRLKVRGTSGNLTKDVDLTVTVSAPSGGGGGGSTSGTVTTPGGPVGVALQGGTFAQGPTAQSVTPPQGFQAPYGGIAFTAQVAQGGTLTVTLTFPQAIPQGAVLKKYQGNAWQDIPGAQLSGSTATYQVQDGGALDADGQANGQVVDPVALLTPAPTFTLSDPSPNPLSVSQGSTAAFQVTLASQNGFQGQVTLSLADGEDPLPQGLAITATDPSPISLQAGGSVTVTATVSAGQGVAPDTYRLKVRAEGGNVVQEKPLSVQVVQPPSFDLSPVSPSAVTTARNPSLRSYNTVSFTLTPQNGFRGQVNLSLVDEGGNPVLGLSLYPASVNVTGTQNFTVYVLADNNIPLSGAGKGYAVRLRASSGSIVREQPLTVDVWTGVGVADLNFQRVAYGNGIFVVAGANGYTSYSRVYVYNPQDGSFTRTFEDNTLCGWPRDVAYDPVHQTWVVVGYLSGLVMVSADNAQTWQVIYGARDPNFPSCSAQYGDGMPLERVRYVNDRLWAWGNAWNFRYLYFSQDGGLTWNSVPLPVPQGYTEFRIKGLTFGQGKYVAVGVLFDSSSRAYGMVAISSDGNTWNVTPVSTPQTPWGAGTPEDVLYVPDWDKFVTVGTLGLLGTSSDGVNWSFQNFYNPYDYNQDVGLLAGLAYGNGAVVAGSWSGPKVLVSTDGQNWRIVPTSCGASAMSVAFGSGIFAHTSAGALCTSP